jgi:hypothetical protein
MKVIRSWLCLFLLLISAHRLPAPISEIPQTTPTPKPKREATPRSKSKPEATLKPKARPNLSFAGTWTGSVISKSSNGNTYSYSYVINISDDEKTVLINQAQTGKSMSGPPTPASCSRFREALTWSFSSAGGTTTYTMRINSNGTASFLREGRNFGGEADDVTYTQTGIFSRR